MFKTINKAVISNTNYVLSLFFLMTVIFIPNIAAADPVKEWTIPHIGTMTVPNEFKAVDCYDFYKTIEKVINAAQKDKTKPIALNIAKNTIYQLQVNDDNKYYDAILAIYKDPGNKAYAPYFKQSLTKKEEELLQELNVYFILGAETMERELNQFLKSYLGKYNVNISFKLLDVMPFTVIENPKEVIYTTSGRVILNIDDIIFPFYIKAYFLKRDKDTVVSMFLLTKDSESRLWNDTDRLLETLKKP